jgi:hypothetical protein
MNTNTFIEQTMKRQRSRRNHMNFKRDGKGQFSFLVGMRRVYSQTTLPELRLKPKWVI